MICRAHLVLRFSKPVSNAYTFERSLGQGGIGQVVQATCHRSNAKRAIKIMSRKSDPSGFEISLMLKLDHPNILRLFETFEEPACSHTYLAMELCRGGPLPNYAKEFFPPLEEAAAAVILWQLLGALCYLQMQSLSHGDICPANVLMLHFDKPPEQNVTKLIDFGAFAGSRTPDIPSTGLVMRALLGWCCGTKGSSLREANHTSKGPVADAFVYSEGGVAVAISRAASDLLNRFAGAEFTAERALKHKWFMQARRGEVPRRKARPRRSPKKDEKEEGKADRREGKAGGAGGEPSEGKVDKKSLKRAQSTGQLLKESDAKDRKESKDATKLALRLETSPSKTRVAPGGWWGGASVNMLNFIPRLRTFCAGPSLLRTMLLVAADALDEEILSPLRAAFQRLDGWCPDGVLTVDDLKHRLPKMGCKEVPGDIDRLLLEADIDGVGVLDFTTFLAIAVGTQEVASTDLGVRTFKILDRDQDGAISVNDLEVFMNKVAKLEDLAALLKDALGNSKPLNLAGFLGILTKATKMELEFAQKAHPEHRLSPAALERLNLALTTSEGLTHPPRCDAIKAKRRIVDMAAEKRRKEQEEKRRKAEKRAKSRRRKERKPVQDEPDADPLTLSLLVESSSDSSESGSCPIPETARDRTDTGDTAHTVDTVGSIDSAAVTFPVFQQLLHDHQRLLVSL